MSALQRAEQRIAVLVEENLRLSSQVQHLENAQLLSASERSHRGIHEQSALLESSTAGVQLAVENAKLAEMHAAAVARADAAQEHVQRFMTLGKRKDASVASLQSRVEEQTRQYDELKALVAELHGERERLSSALNIARGETDASSDREVALRGQLQQALQAAATATSRGTEAAGEAIALRRQAADAADAQDDAERRLEDVAGQLAALREVHDHTVSTAASVLDAARFHVHRALFSSTPMQLRMHQTQVYDLTRRLHVQESASAAFASSLAASGHGNAGVRATSLASTTQRPPPARGGEGDALSRRMQHQESS